MTPFSRRGIGTIVVVASLFLVAGCGAVEPTPDRTPFPVKDQLPAVDTTHLRLPAQFAASRIVDPGWVITPQYADGVYLAAGERDELLEFTAVDIEGDVLWAVQRPASCSGFAVTTDSLGRTIAVLGDTQTTDQALAGTTATAYDLATGDHLWGPVMVPGPLQGPGLVFAAPPDSFMGETGPRIAVNATTGDRAAEESGGVQIIGEYHGTVLTTENKSLIARGSTGDELWRISLADQGWSAAALQTTRSASVGKKLALLTVSDTHSALVDLHTGAVLSETARGAAVDSATGTLAVLNNTGLHTFSSDDQPLWSLAVTAETSIASAGGSLLYLQDNQTVTVHNVLTGDLLHTYEPDEHGAVALPDLITRGGAASLIDGNRRLLATAPGEPG